MTPRVPAAAPRDASSYDRPDTRRPKVIHAVGTADVGRSVTLTAACSRVLLDECTGFATLAEVPAHIRCRRRACANRWRDV